NEALTAARRLWGEEALEPDFALLRNPNAEEMDEFDEVLKRVCERGDAAALFGLLAKGSETVRTEVTNTLINRKPMPIAEARAALNGKDEATVQVAAHLLGRAATEAAG